MNRNLRTLQSSLQGLRNSTGQIVQANREEAAAIRGAVEEQRRAIQVQKELENRNRDGYGSINRIIKQFIIWRVIINTISQAYTNLKQSLEEAFAAVYENTEEYKA